MLWVSTSTFVKLKMKTRTEILCPRTTTIPNGPAKHGAGKNRIDRPERNPEGESGQTLCFVYFQSIIPDRSESVNPFFFCGIEMLCAGRPRRLF